MQCFAELLYYSCDQKLCFQHKGSRILCQYPASLMTSLKKEPRKTCILSGSPGFLSSQSFSGINHFYNHRKFVFADLFQTCILPHSILLFSYINWSACRIASVIGCTPQTPPILTDKCRPRIFREHDTLNCLFDLFVFLCHVFF